MCVCVCVCVYTYGCESWTIKKAEHRRIDPFELRCWRRSLRVPWTARRSNQSILKEISPGVHWKDWCWSWNSNTLATWCEELTHWKRLWCWERLRAGGEGDERGWDGWMASPTLRTWVWASSRSWWWTGSLACYSLWGFKELDMTERMNWTDTYMYIWEREREREREREMGASSEQQQARKSHCEF